MRIIAGQARGTPLKSPSAETRPTSDRVREALFSMLGGRVEGARVLDLFAGSGALGLEALSRGAAEALFVDQSRAACRAIESNSARTRLSGGAFRCGDVFRVLDGLRGGFDLVFADPPYAKNPGDPDFGAMLLARHRLHEIIASDGLLVLETRADGAKNDAPRWEILDSRSYGDTAVTFFRPIHSNPSDDAPA